MSPAAKKSAPAPRKSRLRSATPKGDRARTLSVELYASLNGTPQRQRRIARALGLRRLGATNDLPDSPSVRGMIASIPHLVRVVTEGRRN